MPNSDQDNHEDRLPTPLYFKIKRWIESEITGGRYPVGSQVPTEPELGERFGVSRITVRKALQLLADEGVIWRSRGKGSFVKSVPQAESFSAPHVTRRPRLRLSLSIPFDEVWESDRVQRLWASGHPKIDWEIHHHSSPPSNRLEAFAEEIDVFALDDPAQMRAVEDAGISRPWSSLASPEAWQRVRQSLLPGLAAAFGESRIERFFPQTFSPLGLFYNQADFDAAGVPVPPADWTFRRFVDAACRLRDLFERTGRTDRIPFLAELASFRRWPLFVYMEGGRFWDAPSGKSCFGCPETIRGLEHYRDLIDNYRVSKNLFAAELPVDENLFRRKMVSMHFGSYYTLGHYERAADLDWGIAPSPRAASDRTMMVFGAFAVAKKTPEPGLCWDFLEFMHSPEVQEIYLEERRQIPTSAPAISNWKKRCSAEQLRTLDLFLDSVPRIHPVEYPPLPKAQAKLLELVHLVWFNLARTEELCRQIEGEINTFLENAMPQSLSSGKA